MIKSFKTNYSSDTKRHRYNYVRRNGSGKKMKMLPKKVEFKGGLNVLIGANGCGKSTLLNLLTDFTLARDGLHSQYTFWEKVCTFYPEAFNLCDHDYTPQTLFSIDNDYDVPVNRMDSLDMKKTEGGGDFASMRDFSQFFNEARMSKGQKIISTINATIAEVNEKNEAYSLEKLFPNPKTYNDVWGTAIEKTKEAVLGFHKPQRKKMPVLLMDEPDESLDVINLDMLKNFLLKASEKMQLIVVLHNPLLIKALADKGANIIELSENYLQKIRDFE